VQAGGAPIVALAISSDGTFIAAARNRRCGRHNRPQGPKHHANARRSRCAGLVRGIFTGQCDTTNGGADGTIRRWNALTGDPIGSSPKGTPGDPLAALCRRSWRRSIQGVCRLFIPCRRRRTRAPARPWPACSAAGSRRCPAIAFPDALKSIEHRNGLRRPFAKLFEVGRTPIRPATKMPEQRIGRRKNRKALTDFLARATAK